MHIVRPYTPSRQTRRARAHSFTPAQHGAHSEQQEALSARPPHPLLPLPAPPLAVLPVPSTASDAIPASEPAKWRHAVRKMT